LAGGVNTGQVPIPSTIQTIVIGDGQAGLAVGNHLAKQGIFFEILDANPRIGEPPMGG